MIRLVVRITAMLLGLSSLLVIVGFFDLFLGWDLFSRSVEDVLYGVFFSCITLAIAGIALTLVLGIYEIVILLRASLTGSEVPVGWSNSNLLRMAVGGGVCVVAIVMLLGLADSQIQDSRSSTFKRLANSQMNDFSPKLLRYLPTQDNATFSNEELDLAVTSLRNMDLFRRVEIYMLDSNDPDAIYVYSRPDIREKGIFERRFAAKRPEVAARSALQGDLREIEEFNESSKFQWLQRLENEQGQKAILHLEGNRNAEFRDY